MSALYTLYFSHIELTELIGRQIHKFDLCLGITPYIAQEVGVLTENVKFTSDLRKLPRAAIVSLDEDLTSRPWFLDDRFTIAFPNDMSLYRYKKPYDDTKRWTLI